MIVLDQPEQNCDPGHTELVKSTLNSGFARVNGVRAGFAPWWTDTPRTNHLGGCLHGRHKRR
jgi:hypothetical protein